MDAAYEPDGAKLLTQMLDWLARKGLLPRASAREGNGAGSAILVNREIKQVQPEAKQRAEDVGICAMELYFPPHAVLQQDMEQACGCPGKFTAGLGQEAITFCSDEEDAISMALTGQFIG